MPLPINSITVEEARKQLGLGLNGIYRACERGEIPAIRIGGRWVIPKPAWDKFLIGEWKPKESNPIVSEK